MNKYALFAYCDYYPQGGLNDLMGWFPTVEEAKAAFAQYGCYENASIVEAATWKTVSCWDFTKWVDQ